MTVPHIDNNGNIYIGSSYTFYSIKLTGSLNWTFVLQSKIKSIPYVDSNNLIYISDSYNIYMLNQNGKLVSEGFIYYGDRSDFCVGSDNSIYSENSHQQLVQLFPNGYRNYEYSLDNNIITKMKIFPDGMLYFGTNDGYLYSVNTFTGQQIQNIVITPSNIVLKAKSDAFQFVVKVYDINNNEI